MENNKENGRITLKDVRSNPKVKAYIEGANQLLDAIGYTEHGARHAGIVAAIAKSILTDLKYDSRAAELASIAGFLHDIGNVVHREQHPQISAVIALRILEEIGMEPKEIAQVIGAIGNHEEPEGEPVSNLAAAVIIADKSDVHKSRVQNPDVVTYDIHDRVNSAVMHSHVYADHETKVIRLDLEINPTAASVMDYFEIFVERMVMCNKAAKSLGCEFNLTINGSRLG